MRNLIDPAKQFVGETLDGRQRNVWNDTVFFGNGGEDGVGGVFGLDVGERRGCRGAGRFGPLICGKMVCLDLRGD